jgi:hypothetical protein
VKQKDAVVSLVVTASLVLAVLGGLFGMGWLLVPYMLLAGIAICGVLIGLVWYLDRLIDHGFIYETKARPPTSSSAA